VALIACLYLNAVYEYTAFITRLGEHNAVLPMPGYVKHSVKQIAI